MGFFLILKMLQILKRTYVYMVKHLNGIRKWFFYIMKNDILLGFFLGDIFTRLRKFLGVSLRSSYMGVISNEFSETIGMIWLFYFNQLMW